MKRGCLYKIGHFFLYGLLGLIAILLIAGGISYLVNLNLPTSSKVVDHLDDLEKARLAEFYHLQRTLGDQIWPGWGKVPAPIIVYNEAYAFLVGYPDPPSGWIKMPQNESRGGPWEPISGDLFEGQVYYRQPLTDPKKTPESFTVLVGDRWVTTFQTMEYSAVSFYAGLHAELPPLIREVVPYQLIYNQLIGESDAYITILAHESFHTYQAMTNQAAFSKAEKIMVVQNKYPWKDPLQQDNWQVELDLLVDAAKADDKVKAEELAHQFLAQRDKRRQITGLNADLVSFERQREWLEGLAKYVELSSGLLASSASDYQWLPAMDTDPEFNGYQSRQKFWSRQLDQVRRTTNNEGEIRFYYSGFAQAVLLDKLLPGWKDKVIPEGTALEDLLRLAIAQPSEP